MHVSLKGFSTTDEKTGSTISQNPIHRITAWYPDELDPDIFAVIVKGEGGYTGKEGEFHCIVIKCQQTFAVLGALKELMSLVMQQQQQRHQPTREAPALPAKARKTSATSPSDTWACMECTFANHILLRQCEMCGSQLQPQAGTFDDEYSDYAVSEIC